MPNIGAYPVLGFVGLVIRLMKEPDAALSWRRFVISDESYIVVDISTILDFLSYYLPARRGGPTCKSKSESIEWGTIEREEGRLIVGNTSGINTPINPITIDPLIKSCINCFV